ncbi:glucosyltransferase domain-containing protein [Enterobacter cancerogenus]|uniref:glucosyltransferase domain-containing protein n=1 Tax=Enterobacter cancerogenus TaxID=69218 RepID=UPI0030767A2D
MISFYKKKVSDFNAWLFNFVVIAVSYYPLINDRLYLVDDITRSIKGYFGWLQLGRPLTEWLAMMLSTNSERLADITPLPQILSIFALSYLTMLLLKNLFDEITVGGILICLTVAVNPLVLGNMLFRFDSLSMILSMLMAVIAWDLLNKGKLLYVLILLIASLSFYQPAIAVFPLLVMTKFIQNEKNEKQSINYIFKAFVVTMLSCAIYYILIVKSTINETEKRADLSSGFINNIISGVNTSLSIALQSYGYIACIMIALSTIIFTVIYFKFLYDISKKKFHRKTITTLLLAISVPFVMLTCSAGVNLTLSNGYYPVRVLFPIAFIVFIMLVIPALFSNHFKLASSYLSIVLILTSTSVIYATASSLYHQQRYDEYVLFSLSEKLSSLKSNKSAYIFNATDSSGASETSMRVFPILNHIKNNYYDMTLSQSLMSNGIKNIKFSGQDRIKSYSLEKMACQGQMKLIYSMPQYSIFENDTSLLIYLGGNICNK